MLELKNIVKDYVSGDNVTHALKGLNVNFRRNEFVSILGPSGCGKTTTLNIIGGLDRYTSGDLIIEGKSTKDYSDRDWDTYRNHSIGFVFQTYNLIGHLNIARNVELALTIGGISKEGRQERALQALKRVGLENEARKKPNQLSGGQMQRVAIARALVNDPEIVLADEPTGALDSETSIQIMDLLKEVAKDRLVIMVTHNPDLAKKYSSRIITMKDGELTNDSNPFDGVDKTKSSKPEATKKAKMKLNTAFGLSARNLLSKAKRSVLVCVAGSIGIIGVSTVLAVSTGVKSYVNNMQDDMLSGNPITISKNSLDLNAMLDASSTSTKKEAIKESHRDGYIDVDYFIKYLAEQKDNLSNYAVKNEITPEYIKYLEVMPKENYGALRMSYGLNTKLNLFTNVKFTLPDNDADKPEIQNIDHVSLQYLIEAYTAIVKTTSFGQFADMIKLFTNAVSVAPDTDSYVASQYEVLTGKIATEEDEMMIVVSKDKKLRDIFLGQIGYYSQDEFIDVINKYAQGTEVELTKKDFSYEELLSKEFYYVENNQLFSKNHAFDNLKLEDPTTYVSYKAILKNILISQGTDPAKADELADTYLTQFKTYKKMNEYKYKGYINKGETVEKRKIKITGIIQPKESVQYGCLQSGFVISNKMQQYFINKGIASDFVTYLNQKNAEYEADKTSFSGIMTPLEYKYAYHDVEHPDNPVELKKVELPKDLVDGTTTPEIMGNLAKLLVFFAGDRPGSAVSVVDIASAAGGLASNSVIQALFGDSVSVSSQFDSAVRSLGGNDLPNKIEIYPTSFDEKYNVTDYLDRWNSKDVIEFTGKDGVHYVLQPKDSTMLGATIRQDIKYTDSIEIIISLINSMIEIVTIALICFTSLSLVVSTVMIGIITYVSVVERVKEIGIIRSLGGRKLDVSNLFNVETFIIGLVAGLFGILVTYGLSGIINIIINMFARVGAIVILPWNYALIVVAVSVGLTLISGLIPARAAAHKDPVVALRTGE